VSATAGAAHKWEFKARFRRHAFGWRSQPAVQRIKQAVSEIKKVARAEALLSYARRALRRFDGSTYWFLTT